MTKLKKSIIAALAITLIIYLAASFVTWDCNPGNWHEFTRGMVCASFMISAGIAVGLINDFEK